MEKRNEAEKNAKLLQSRQTAPTVTGGGPQMVFFTREQLLSSGRYREQRDLIAALFADEKRYSLAEVDRMIGEYKKGKVN